MPLVFAAILPHGSDIVAELSDDPQRMARTRAAMREAGRRFRDASPETTIVLTPHGLVLENAVTVSACDRAEGSLPGIGDDESGTGEIVLSVPAASPSASRGIAASFDVDRSFAARVVREGAREGVPIVPLGISTDEETNSDNGDLPFPLDWGALVPLWFTAQTMEERSSIVVAAPDRDLPRDTLVRAGVVLARAARASGKRVVLLASCDQGHAHAADGPYGFHTDSAIHDRLMVQAVEQNNLKAILSWDDGFLERAKVDGYWQTLILLGALGQTPMTPELLYYERPTYFGMLTAVFSPKRRRFSFFGR